MKHFLKNLLRPKLLPILSAPLIAYIIYLLIMPVMLHFPIFYQGQVNAEPAYMLKFQTSITQPTLFITGGSRFFQMAYSDEHVNAELKNYSDKDFVYANLGANNTLLIEQLVLIDQSHYMQGSVVLLGVNIRQFAKVAPNSSNKVLDNPRLSFLDYKESKEAINDAGFKFRSADHSFLYRSRDWLANFLAKFKWRVLFCQSWNVLGEPFNRPSLFGVTKDIEVEKERQSIDRFNENHLANRKLLEFVINYAQREKGYQVYLFQAPSPPLIQQFEAPYSSTFNKDLNYLVEKTGVKIISANNTLLKDSDFYDLMHLNEFGRERYEATFTQQLTDVANDSFSQ
jgi:hypothetical protein